MRSIRKSIIFFAALLFLYAALPAARADAAQINRFGISDAATFAAVTYLIAGKQYYFTYDTDKAGTTSIEKMMFGYSADQGVTWTEPPVRESDGFLTKTFMLPIDPQLTSAHFRLSAYFDPLIGAKSYSEKKIGPYKILQPADLSDFTATSNDDGTVTLNWSDNSNMESYYQITRYGPEGTKTFYVNNTMDNIGPLSYADKQTITDKSTVYVYSLTPVVDKYELPDNLRPGTVNVIAKTKAKASIIKINPEKYIVDASILKYINDLHLNIDKKAVSGVKLDKKSITLSPGESEKLTATVTPLDADNQKVVWSSDNPQIAEVDGTGNVTGKASGFAKITVKTESGSFTDTSIATVVSNSEPAPIFPDIAGHKAREEIEKAVSLQIVSGYPDGTFLPDGNVTRAEFAKMIVKGLKTEGDGDPLTFADKEDIGDWAMQPVRQAVKLGLIFGYDDNTFRPNANITHAEMIAMVMRASGLPAGNAQKTGFADDADIPEWAKPSVSKAEETGIIIVGGLPEGEFKPQALSTRAEAVSSIVRMLGKKEV